MEAQRLLGKDEPRKLQGGVIVRGAAPNPIRSSTVELMPVTMVKMDGVITALIFKFDWPFYGDELIVEVKVDVRGI